MSDAAVLTTPDLSEVSAKSKNVREQLRVLAETLDALAAEVSDKSSVAEGRLSRVRLNVVRAIEEFPCTESSQLPF
jgi:ABC-type transporter Mla subunit MlaD